KHFKEYAVPKLQAKNCEFYVIRNERVPELAIYSFNNGERFVTYVIKGERNSGVVCLNGPAARRVQLGDIVIVASYAMMEKEEAKNFKPVLVYPDEKNQPVK
ncbi:MAG TPA: aspartate 1-decarboxylase, partial [Bacteroidia bacterium]|nr:aspartate 1-decarboxylase [Bacteroidia bacterium]